MKRIFISYSRLDRDFARRLATSLQEVGADVWIDYEDIPAGNKWSTAIQQGLDSSDGLLIIVSPESMRSSNVEDEWQYFVDSGKPVIPILYKAAKLHFQLHRLQYVDFSSYRFGDAFAKLLDELNNKGITIEVEAVEETSIFEIKPTKPPKAEVQYIADTKRETIPSIKHKSKPVLEKPKLNGEKASPSYTGLGLGLLLLAIIIFGAVFVTTILNQPPQSPEADLSEFGDWPSSLYFSSEDFVVRENTVGLSTDRFNEMYIINRFFEDGREWYSIYEFEEDTYGYQSAENLSDIEPYLLPIVPLQVPLSAEEIRLYTAPDAAASSKLMRVHQTALAYGYRYDAKDTLWYYVWVEIRDGVNDGDGYVGWISAPSDIYSIVGDSPAIGFTTAASRTYWDSDLEEEVFTIPANEVLRIFGKKDNLYHVAYFTDNWYIVWLAGETVDINENTLQFVRGS